MGNREEESRIQQILVESIKVLCRSIVSFKESLQIDGLVGIRVDNKDVLLVKIENVVGAEAVPVLGSDVSQTDVSSLQTPMQEKHEPAEYGRPDIGVPVQTATSRPSAMSNTTTSHFDQNMSQMISTTPTVRKSREDTPQISSAERKRIASHPEDDAPKILKRRTPSYEVQEIAEERARSTHLSTAAPSSVSGTAGSAGETRPSAGQAGAVWYQFPKPESAEPAAVENISRPAASSSAESSAKPETEVTVQPPETRTDVPLDSVKHEDLEKKLMSWIKDQWSRNITVSNAEIREKALEFYNAAKQVNMVPPNTFSTPLASHMHVNPLLVRYTQAGQDFPACFPDSAIAAHGRDHQQLVPGVVRMNESPLFHILQNSGDRLGHSALSTLHSADLASVFSLPVPTTKPQAGTVTQHLQPVGHVQPIVQPMVGRFQPVLGPVHAVEPTMRSDDHSPAPPRAAFSSSAQSHRASPRKANTPHGNSNKKT